MAFNLFKAECGVHHIDVKRMLRNFFLEGLNIFVIRVTRGILHSPFLSVGCSRNRQSTLPLFLHEELTSHDKFFLHRNSALNPSLPKGFRLPCAGVFG